jgi:hypothetical protein
VAGSIAPDAVLFIFASVFPMSLLATFATEVPLVAFGALGPHVVVFPAPVALVESDPFFDRTPRDADPYPSVFYNFLRVFFIYD